MNTEPRPIYGDGNPETHPLTWRLSKQEHVRNADDYEALEGCAGFKKAISMPPKDVLGSLLSKPIIRPLIQRFGYRQFLLTNTLLVGGCIASFALTTAETATWLRGLHFFIFGELS